jgi:hypothetical protein
MPLSILGWSSASDVLITPRNDASGLVRRFISLVDREPTIEKYQDMFATTEELNLKNVKVLVRQLLGEVVLSVSFVPSCPFVSVCLRLSPFVSV